MYAQYAQSLSRFSALPPISPEQSADKRTMSLSEMEVKPSKSSGVTVSGSAATVSKPPAVKPRSPVKTTAVGGSEKPDSEVDSKASCLQTEAQCSGESETEATLPVSNDAVQRELVRSQDAKRPAVPEEKKTVSLSETEMRSSKSLGVAVSCSAATVSKPPVVKPQSLVTAKTTAVGGSEKPDSQVDSKASCLQVEARCDGEPETEATLPVSNDAVQHELIRSQDGKNAAVPEDEDVTLTANENENDDSSDDDDDDDPYTSVSFI